MGFALAQQAAAAGADVVLVSGPGEVSSTDAPGGNLQIVDVVSADEMLNAVMENIPGADVFIGAAAVADYRPAQHHTEKMKKGAQELQLTLQRTTDILQTVSHNEPRPQMVVGFAAETADLEANARAKLQAKDLDLVAANSVAEEGSGFGVDTNRVTLLGPDDFRQELPLMSKWAVADVILDLIAERLQPSAGA
jgi:phosphopantothenoylcysteine decarboxylase/phosphopantothenate--cysteine ligase